MSGADSQRHTVWGRGARIGPLTCSTVAPVEGSTRKFVTAPASLVALASEIARARGDRLSEIVRTATIAAAKAAERGDYDLVPKPPLRQTGDGEEPEKTSNIGITATVSEFERCTAALRRAGTTRQAVAVHALGAYVAADGDRLDAVMPGEAPRTPARPKRRPAA